MFAAFLKKWKFLLLAALFAALGLVLRKTMPLPYVWVFSFAAWTMACAFLTARMKSSPALYACIVVASIFASLTIMEGYLISLEPPPVKKRSKISRLPGAADDPSLLAFGENRNRNDPVLGYSPQKGAVRVASTAVFEGTVLYDVIYSSLDSGWRVTPQHPDAGTAVIFFGCSFTIGEGLDDEDSIPYQVGALLGSDCQVFNFAYHGYGAHHMLAQLENGYLDEIGKKYKTVIAFFPTIGGHELRCSGMSYWDNHGPWYALENGRLIHKGNFTHNPVIKNPPGYKWFRNCLIYKNITATKTYELGPLRELHAAIIEQSAAILREKYNAPLVTVLWPGVEFQENLRRRHVDFVDLADILPDWASAPERYVIAHDGHPNAFAAGQVARHLSALIRKRLGGHSLPKSDAL